jgi:hypothetical protein
LIDRPRVAPDPARLGSLASHGCVRLYPAQAVAFGLVERSGLGNTRIEIKNGEQGASLNRAITVSFIDQVSCASYAPHASVVQIPQT